MAEITEFDLNDPVTRLVAADWLQERDRPEEESLLRGTRPVVLCEGRVTLRGSTPDATARHRVEYLFAEAQIAGLRAEEESQEVDCEHPYDPLFYLQINLSGDLDHAQGGWIGDLSESQYRDLWDSPHADRHAEEVFRVAACDLEEFGGWLSLVLQEEFCAHFLATNCCRWYGDDGHAGDNAERTLHAIGSDNLNSSLAVEVDTWQQASLENTRGD
jgi:hypothetical protein